MYIITKEGVYRHEVYGPYSSETEAKDAAHARQMSEPDKYHEWAVVWISRSQAEYEIGRWSYYLPKPRPRLGRIEVNDPVWRQYEASV